MGVTAHEPVASFANLWLLTSSFLAKEIPYSRADLPLKSPELSLNALLSAILKSALTKAAFVKILEQSWFPEGV